MVAQQFEIYQTEAGYVAVTSDVRRKILDALSGGDRQLGDLVKATGKSKPTLSSVHLKELLHQHLIEERPDPHDHRRKWYRVIGRKIGSSSIPVDQLREAVKRYVAMGPLASRVPLAAVFDVLGSAPDKASERIIRAQARRLGQLAGPNLPASSPMDVAVAAAQHLEREGLLKILRVDFQNHTLDVEPASPTPETERFAEILAGFIEGAGEKLRLDPESVRIRADGVRRIQLKLPG